MRPNVSNVAHVPVAQGLLVEHELPLLEAANWEQVWEARCQAVEPEGVRKVQALDQLRPESRIGCDQTPDSRACVAEVDEVLHFQALGDLQKSQVRKIIKPKFLHRQVKLDLLRRRGQVSSFVFTHGEAKL